MAGSRVQRSPRAQWMFVLAFTSALLVAGFCVGLYGTSRDVADSSTTPGFLDQFSDLQLVDHDGRGFRPASLQGKVVVVNFVFTGCSTTCPTQTRELAAVQQTLPTAARDGVRFLSISVDPLGDTPAILKAYAKSAGADFSSWTFATGRPQDIQLLGERLRLFRNGASPGRPEDHAASLWLVDGAGRLMQRYSGTTGGDFSRLANEIQTLHAMAAPKFRQSQR
ncbi:SCO family protein [Variovorax sp. RHLX14]|uniref:SCO family protein n=1 Tax=Variovorax sp. RHLX14 TaxID=1259731 RepID=UPI003F47D8A0